MAQSESIRERMPEWFEECVVKVRKQQTLFMRGLCVDSVNSLVKCLG